MLWLILSILPSFFYAITNHIDKQLLERYFKEGGVGTLLLFSTLFAFLILPYPIAMDSTILSIKPINAVIMYGAGLLNVALLFFYFKALEKDEPTVVILYYQLVPVITLGLGWLILNETITALQAIAMVVIIAGTTLATIEFSEVKEIRFKWRTLAYMLIATTCWAGETTIGKIVVLDESVYHSIFWESIALVSIGILLFLFRPFYRREFLRALNVNSTGIISLNILNEGIYGVGNAIVTHAVLLAPVALVLLFQPTQAIFVFLIGIVLTLFFPNIHKERIDPMNLMLKILAMVITIAGTVLLALLSPDLI